MQAELTVRKELATVPDILRGGAIMALADNLGGVATVVNLPKGARTATIESKTNFFTAIPVGETARAECTPLHRGRITMVWQTKITRNDGRLCARDANPDRYSGREGLGRVLRGRPTDFRFRRKPGHKAGTVE